MAVSSELSSLLNALDDPAMLIRPEDMSVAAVNAAFQRVFGAFRFEGRRCWEALHRPDACSRCGLGCPVSALTRTRSEVHVEQTLFAGAGLVRFRVSLRPTATSSIGSSASATKGGSLRANSRAARWGCRPHTRR